MEWHDSSCPRLDLRSYDGIDSCLRCGSFSGPATALLFPPILKQSDIRLLYLSPGTFEQDIRCEISVHDLSLRPKYEAVSYTWADGSGNDDLCKTIFVSGQPLSVTRNCENALKRIRRVDMLRVVWIDAVCINQNDTNERGHQVQLMPQVYSRAQGVLIYIGESADNSDFCLYALGSGHMHSFSEAEYSDFYTALSCLLRRHYFSRAWVLQEVALARTATVICGGKKIRWTQLCKAELKIPDLEEELRKLMSTPILKMKEAELYTTPDRLLDLLDISRRCNAKDPRDKVYALLGLIVDHDSLGLAADYTLSVKDLYVKVALGLASRYGWATVLCRAGIKYRSIDTLPSWVPDWSHSIEETPILVKSTPDYKVKYKAIQYDDKNDSLNLRAFSLGFMDDSEVYLPDNIHPEYLQTNGNGDTSVPQYLYLDLDIANRLGNLSSISLSFSLRLHLCDRKITGDDSSTTIRFVTRDSAYGKAVRVHDAAVWLTLIHDGKIHSMLQSIHSTLRSIGRGGDEMGQPWLVLLNFMEPMKNSLRLMGYILDNINRDEFLEVIRHESRPHNDLDLLWRNTFALNPSREAKLRKAGRDYELVVDFNEAIWKLLVRCFLLKEVEFKIT